MHSSHPLDPHHEFPTPFERVGVLRPRAAAAGPHFGRVVRGAHPSPVAHSPCLLASCCDIGGACRQGSGLYHRHGRHSRHLPALRRYQKGQLLGTAVKHNSLSVLGLRMHFMLLAHPHCSPDVLQSAYQSDNQRHLPGRGHPRGAQKTDWERPAGGAPDIRERASFWREFLWVVTPCVAATAFLALTSRVDWGWLAAGLHQSSKAQREWRAESLAARFRGATQRGLRPLRWAGLRQLLVVPGRWQCR